MVPGPSVAPVKQVRTLLKHQTWERQQSIEAVTLIGDNYVEESRQQFLWFPPMVTTIFI